MIKKKKEEELGSSKSPAFEQALRHLDTLGDIDISLVPTKATPEMLARVSKATGLPEELINDIYAKMIKVSQEG